MPSPLKKPNLERQFRAAVVDELHALRSFARYNWRVVLWVALAIGVFLYEVRPFPPKEVTIATGQPSSTYNTVGLWYQKYFAKHGITLNLVSTNGAVDNNQLLSEGKVDAAFTQAGVPLPNRGIAESLGSVEYEPMCLLYRGARQNDFELPKFLATKRVSIGAEGSGTRYMTLDLLREHDFDLAKHENFLQMNVQDSVDALHAGKIDAMFLLADVQSKQLWELLNDPDIYIWDFRTSKAISSKLGYADPVVFPIGSISLNPIEPARDINLVANHTKVLVNKDVHPAIQYLFMMAAGSFYRHTDVYFNRTGGFPAFIDNEVDKSEVAVKYLRTESTFLQRTFPFWLASFLDRAWLSIAALIAIIYPLFKIVPKYRNVHFNADITDHYLEMKVIDDQIDQSTSQPELMAIYPALDALDDKAAKIWVPISGYDRYYAMMNSMSILRRRLDLAVERYKAN